MGTSTLPRRSLYFTRKPLAAISGKTKTYFAKESASDGSERQVLRIENMPIFRSGTFRDSMGWQNTWEPMHLHEMVMHFDHLRNEGIFPDVPVRAGHPSFLGGNPVSELIGYIEAVRTEKRTSPVDNTDYEYLLADYVILDPSAAEKINSGLWRNRSSEVGTYVSNSEAEYAPVLMGLAYVDIPAVESLNAFRRDSNSECSVMMEDGEMPMPTPKPPTGDKKDGDNSEHSAPPAPPSPPSPPAPFSFSIGGKQVTDPAAVQAHITAIESANRALEEFQANTLAQQREDFVKSLAAANKIGANQIDSYTGFAKELSDKQYEAWKATFADAQPQPLFGNHGSQTPAGASPDDPAPKPDEDKPDPLAVPKGILVNLHRAGTSLDKIKRSQHYAKVVAAEPNFDLAALVAAK